ncbi:MAG: PKD domain-containing protein, partial [Bacteroidota bacterium]
GTLDATKEWTVNVLDFDVGMLLNQINDVTVNEGETARLNLPDFAKYGLSYTISEPLGNKNEWRTTYDDSGEYAVFIHVVGNGFKGDKTAAVTVRDVDRPPVFDEIGNKLIDENQTFTINLNAVDPDGDGITYSVDKLPEGAALEGNKFTWTPGFDTVKKEDFIDKVVDKFTVLSKTFYLQFAAASNGKKILHNVIITVKDVNRAPVLEDMQPITVNEGDTIKIAPSAYDLDGDKVTLSYSGFMASDTYKTKFGDAGTKYVTVTASDGTLIASKTVQIIINHVNRPPVLDKIDELKATEGDHIEIVLNAHDPDGDRLQYSVSNAPPQASLSGNQFIWNVPYDFANRKGTRTLDLVFYVSDGNLSASQPAKVKVTDKNRAPRIINASRSVVTKVNEPVFMFVKAVDDDNDTLTYTWDFGLLEKYRATENHERIFSTPGNKVVKVIVSDGTDSVEQIINILVQDNSNYNSRFLNESVYIKVRKFNVTYKETRVLSAQNVQSLTTSRALTSATANSAAANRPPRIIESTNNVVAKVGQPVLLYAKAVDDDNDSLAYTWDFGFMDSHRGQYQQRTFATAGNKVVKVTVSDGHYNVVQTLNVNVVE